MTEQSSPSGKFPIWIIGVVVGVLVGAFLIFGMGSSTEKAAPESESAGGTTSSSPIDSSGATGVGVAPSTGVGSAAPVSLAEWNERINGATVENYGELMKSAVGIRDAAVRKQVTEKLLLKWLDTDQNSFLDFLDDAEFSASEGQELWPALVPAAAEVLPSVSEAAAGKPELDEIIQWMVEYYAEMDPPKAADWARQWLLDDTRDYALATVAGEMAVKSRADALALLDTLQTPDARLEAVMNIGAVLAETDSEGALAWAQGLTNADERDAAVEEVLWTMSEVDPSQAAAKLTESASADKLDAVSGSIAEEWAIQDPVKAIGWAESLPEGAARNEAVQGALAGWAENDPKAAFDYFTKNHSGNPETAEWIFDAWAFNNPSEASVEVLNIQDPALRERAISGVVTGWIDEGSTDAVEQWVDQLPEGRQRDQASFAIVDMLSFDEPAPAWSRALTIKEPDLRSEAMQVAFSGLAETDGAEARKALSGSNLTPEEIQALQPLLEINEPQVYGQPQAVTPAQPAPQP